MLLGNASSEAAEFSPLKDGAIWLDGEIVGGDTRRLYDAVTAEQAKGIKIVSLLLNSSGGSIDESYDLAMFVDGMGLATGVAVKHKCLSACTTVLAAGVKRYIAMGSLVGVHSAATSKVGDDGKVEEGSGTEDADASTTTLEWARVMKSYGTPDTIIVKMITTPADKMTWLTIDDFAGWAEYMK